MSNNGKRAGTLATLALTTALSPAFGQAALTDATSLQTCKTPMTEDRYTDFQSLGKTFRDDGCIYMGKTAIKNLDMDNPKQAQQWARQFERAAKRESALQRREQNQADRAEQREQRTYIREIQRGINGSSMNRQKKNVIRSLINILGR